MSDISDLVYRDKVTPVQLQSISGLGRSMFERFFGGEDYVRIPEVYNKHEQKMMDITYRRGIGDLSEYYFRVGVEYR